MEWPPLLACVGSCGDAKPPQETKIERPPAMVVVEEGIGPCEGTLGGAFSKGQASLALCEQSEDSRCIRMAPDRVSPK